VPKTLPCLWSLRLLAHIGTHDASPETVAKKLASFRRVIIYITYVVLTLVFLIFLCKYFFNKSYFTLVIVKIRLLESMSSK